MAMIQVNWLLLLVMFCYIKFSIWMLFSAAL